jgi:HEAT repeat protein
LGEQLESLVQATPDPFHLIYVLENLRLPHPNHQDYIPALRIKTNSLQRLLNFSWNLQVQTRQKTQSDFIALWSQIDQTIHRSEYQEQQQFFRNLLKADKEGLKSALTDKNPMVRLTAIQFISRRRLHLERDLIERLLDPQPLIRVAAHQALIRLGRGVDFGPKLGAPVLEQHQAVRRWKNWLALQNGGTETILSNPLAAETDADADRLVVELVQAKQDREIELLESLRTSPEPHGTLVLAAAIRELKLPRQAKVRHALAQRLADMDASQLKKRFRDEDAEVRQAALAGAGMKKDKALIADTLKLLEDPDPGVAHSARSTLKLLTGRDFGPPANASPLDRSIAIGQWYAWWLQQKKGK